MSYKLFKTKEKSMELTVLQKKEINKKIFSMIVPITMENILQMVVGLVTMGLIGHIDAFSVSAVGVGSRITNLIWAFFKGISVATTVFVAQYYGAGEDEKLKKIVQQSVLSVMILMLIVMIFVLLFTEQILSIFNPDPELMKMSVEFLRIAIIGLPFFIVLITVNASFQGTGNTKTPLMLSVIMNIINMSLGYILIFGVIGEPLGIKGAAIAMAISQIVTGLIGLTLMLKNEKFLKKFRNMSFFKLEIKNLIKLYKVGIPSAMEITFWQIATIILTRAILTFGATAYASHQLGLQAESVSFMPAQGFGVAATALVGQCLGAKQNDLAKVYFKSIAKWGFLVALIGALLLLLMPNQLMMLLTNDPEIIKLGSIYLMLMGISQMPQNMEKILTGAMRGAGYTKTPMYVAAIGLWGIRIPLSLISTYVLGYGIIPVWIIIDIDVLSRFCISLYMYKRYNIYQKNILQS
ncbi:MAG: MATE family efflux transporter [Filifactoraceae bacterium]